MGKKRFWLLGGWLLGTVLFLVDPRWVGWGQTLPPAVVYLPIVAAPAPTIRWDPRLDQRGAYLIPAWSGRWRLRDARWLDEQEAGGRHHIFMDTLDATGQRMTDVRIQITWPGGSTVVTTAAKPGEPYAADFPMYAVAPAYMAAPAGGDVVGGMGLGSIEQPDFAIHTSYVLTWQLVPGDDYAR